MSDLGLLLQEYNFIAGSVGGNWIMFVWVFAIRKVAKCVSIGWISFHCLYLALLKLRLAPKTVPGPMLAYSELNLQVVVSYLLQLIFGACSRSHSMDY